MHLCIMYIRSYVYESGMFVEICKNDQISHKLYSKYVLVRNCACKNRFCKFSYIHNYICTVPLKDNVTYTLSST